MSNLTEKEKAIKKAEKVWEDHTCSPIPTRHRDLFDREILALGEKAHLHVRKALRDRRERYGHLKNAYNALPSILSRAKQFRRRSEWQRPDR